MLSDCGQSEWNSLYGISVCVVSSLLLCWVLSCSSYSGQDRPPLFGDYEAQRHWMEVAVNIPISQVYQNSSANDLSYWGLDYPPLTVYHSFLMGKFQQLLLNHSWVELNASHGFQSYHHKYFMRSSVVIAYLLVYVPASVLLSSLLSSPTKSDIRPRGQLQILHLCLFLMNPSLLLVDCAHFQYNSVSLGLFMLSFYFILTDRVVHGSVFFCLSLNYKQMELYHSLPVFSFLLSYKCFTNSSFKNNRMDNNCERSTSLCSFFLSFLKLTLTVLFTFAILWLPYLDSLESVTQVVSRLFPLNRGLFEDKVANLWCTINNVIKIRLLVPSSHTLALLSGVVTLLGTLPSNILLFKHAFDSWRSRRISNNSTQFNFSLCLTSTALSFFLFSYQVHEKSILLFTIPLTFLLNRVDNPHVVIHFVVSVSTLSMSHLFVKDNFLLVAVALTLMLALLFHFFHPHPLSAQTSLSLLTSWLGFLLLIVLMCFGPRIERLPDLYVVLLCAYSFLHFGLFYIYTIYLVFCAMNILPRTLTIGNSQHAQMNKSK